jgi:hypothetical protein
MMNNRQLSIKEDLRFILQPSLLKWGGVGRKGIDLESNLLLQQTLNYRGERMPARKVKNDNKEKELRKKREPVEEEIEDTAEQINIEEEPTESERPK